MKVRFPEPGTYVLAVSGGVDSIALLDMLAKRPGLKLVVAHFNHHMRSDSDEDAKLVRELSKKYNLPFEVGEEHLGANANEAEARGARYKFLRTTMSKYNAKAIITAHHEDDLIETAVLNILRGTGPRGLVAIASNTEVFRPLLGVKKAELMGYALSNKLIWREDPTNTEQNILRNYVRLNILPKMTEPQRNEFLDKISGVAKLEKNKDELIATLSQKMISENELDRSKFGLTVFEVGNSVLHSWLKDYGVNELNRQLIVRLNNFIRTGKAGTNFDVDKSSKMTLTKEVAKLTTKN